MSQYSGQEPQQPQQNPYVPYNPYNTQESQPTYISQQPPQSYPAQQQHQQQSYPAQQPPQPPQFYPPQQVQQPYASYTQEGKQAGKGNLVAQGWQAVVRLLGIRGVIVVVGSLLAMLAFFVLPSYSIYSGYFIAAEELDDKWWLELILAVLPLIILVAQHIVPRVKLQKKRWSLVIAGSGVLGLLLHYWFMNDLVSTNYWRLGSWTYLLGMALVAIGGILLTVNAAPRQGANTNRS
jgi:hypothetical protein